MINARIIWIVLRTFLAAFYTWEMLMVWMGWYLPRRGTTIILYMTAIVFFLTPLPEEPIKQKEMSAK